MEIAKTIISQINAMDYWARARWGVTEMMASETGIVLKVHTNHKQTSVVIEYDAGSDLYNVEYNRIKYSSAGKFVSGADKIVIARSEGIYNEDLVRTIDKMISDN